MYEDSDHQDADWPHWAAGAEPLALTPVVRVDTNAPVDHAALMAVVIAQL
jgi:hypothetical protein